MRHREKKLEIKGKEMKKSKIKKTPPSQAREALRWYRFFSTRQGRIVGPDGNKDDDGDGYHDQDGDRN